MTPAITVGDIASKLEAWAPLESAESYDNSGLQVGRPGTKVTTAIVGLDLTPALIQQAREKRAALIITHHPLFFSPIKSITPDTLVGAMALEMAELKIAHYAIHTNLDAARDGVSFALAGLLGLTDIDFLSRQGPDSSTGMGAIGRLPEPLSIDAFLAHVAGALKIQTFRHVSREDGQVQSVAVCGGSGTSLLSAAIEAQADAFVTADVKYHQFSEVLTPLGTPLLAYLDVGHFESEQITETLLRNFLCSEFPDVAWITPTAPTSPVRNFVAK